MKKFVFSLDRVLALRRVERDREAARLEAAVAAERAIERKVRDVASELGHARARIIGIESAQASDLAAADAWMRDLRGVGRRLDVEAAAARDRTAAQRRVVVAASSRVRLLERLEAARQRDWRAGIERELEADAQELWLARWRNRHG